MSASARADARGAERARQEAQRKDAGRRRAVAWGGGVLIVVLLVAIAAAVVSARGGGQEPQAAGAVVVPANATAEGAFALGQVDAPVTVTVFFDYLCPFCGRFEAANGAELEGLTRSGVARVELRPMSFLDPQSQGTEYSTRAANALATVADGSPERLEAFHRGLFDEQPAEGTAGLDDQRITEIARTAGVAEAVAERFAARSFDRWVAQGTERAFASGIDGTPTVLVDGEVFGGDLYAAGPLTEAVRAAADR